MVYFKLQGTVSRVFWGVKHVCRGGELALVFSNWGGYCFLSGVHVCIKGVGYCEIIRIGVCLTYGVANGRS